MTVPHPNWHRMICDGANTFYPDLSAADGVSTTAGDSDALGLSVEVASVILDVVASTSVVVENHGGTETFWTLALGGTPGDGAAPQAIYPHARIEGGFRVTTTGASAHAVVTWRVLHLI